MPGYWNLSEARLVQERRNLSAANADSITCGYPGPPDGKMWVVTAFGYYPSVGETQLIGATKISGRTGAYFSLYNPVSLTLNPPLFTFLEQGLEALFFPLEYLQITRGNHTAGSTMSVAMQFVEIDMPLYEYIEPQEAKRLTLARTKIIQAMGSGRGRAPGARDTGGGEGGGRRGLPR